jgi:Transposase DDE domain group 1
MNAQLSKDDLISGNDPMQVRILMPSRPAFVQLAPVAGKAVELDFAGGLLSSDAGLVLLKDVDAQLGLSRALSEVLKAPREPRRINFTVADRIQQRACQIAAGYEDANDSNALRHDPIFTLLLGRLPQSGPSLASPPTISRCKNGVSRSELYRLAVVLVAQLITSYDKPPEVLVRDFDDTEDAVHGEQEQARDNRHYGGYCFLPLHVYEGLSGRLITTILKAQRFTGAQLLSVWKRLVKRLRHAWPETLLLSRGDSHFAYPEVMQWIAAQPQRHSVTGLTSHKILQALAPDVVQQATRAYQRLGRQVTRFHSTSYQAGPWCRKRRVVRKVEGSEQGHQHPLCGHRYGAGPHPGAVPHHLLCSWRGGKR